MSKQPEEGKASVKAFNNYKIDFDFTTCTKTGRFTGRSGYLSLQSESSLEELHGDYEEIQKVCAAFVNESKPMWNVFMLTIKNITKLNSYV